MSIGRPKVLFLTHRLPYPPDRGDRIRAYHMAKFLSKTCDVYLGSVADEPWDISQIASLERFCKEVFSFRLPAFGRWGTAALGFSRGLSVTQGAFFCRPLANQVRRWTEEPMDAALIFCSSMGQYIDHFGERPRKVVLDLVDVDSQKWVDYALAAVGPKRWLFKAEASRVGALEAKLAATVDSTVVVSDDEAELFSLLHPDLEAAVVGNGVDLHYFSPDCVPMDGVKGLEVGDPQLVFVGVMDYLPNVQGVQWFCSQVMPLLRKSLPNVRLSVVGRNPTPEVLALGKIPEVEIVGQVPDVRPYLLASHMAIAPLQIARGVQNKVLEALACGKPVIASPQAAAGIDAMDGISVAVEPQEWVRMIENLMVASVREKHSRLAREQMLERYSWESRLSPLLPLLGIDS